MKLPKDTNSMLKQLLIGAGTLLNIMPNDINIKPMKAPKRSSLADDANALAGDRMKIQGDIEKAIQKQEWLDKQD